MKQARNISHAVLLSAMRLRIAFQNSRCCTWSQSLNIRPSTVRLATMIFANARLIFPDEIRDGLNVVVEHGKIAAVSARSLAHRKHDVIDLNGNYLAPGFIDVHVH